ncbi:MAG: RagB/SusD family nutrient uptake outer membrane protein, partial [Odoribacter sp.]|nr:RagB/SusD family nutrient uptake outer membrane protein [Odoribacter sp.]
MKKYIAIGSLCATLFFAGCDNYLDIVPKGQSVLNTTSDYIGLLEEGDPNFEMNTFYYMADEASMRDMNDIETYKYPLTSIAFFWDEVADRIKYTVTETDDPIYAHCYRRISRYNIVIEHIGDADGSEADKKLGIAQAKILRAYNYFFLVNTYAKQYDPATAATDPGIIIHEKFDLEATSRQYTVQQVYDFIERDIKDALPDLPEKPVNSYRPSKAFGYGLKAKVLLFKGDIDGSLTAGLEVLKSSYHHLWDMNENYQVIYQILKSMHMENMWSSMSAMYR